MICRGSGFNELCDIDEYEYEYDFNGCVYT